MQDNLITVTKTASEALPPDTAEISVTAACTGKRHIDATSGAELIAIHAIKKLNEAGFDARMLGRNVSEHRESGKKVGYRAVQAFIVSFPFDAQKLGAAMDALENISCEWRLAFSLKDDSARAELIAKAVKEAKIEAEIIAAAAGVKIGRLHRAEHGASDADRPMLMRAYSDAAAQPEYITLAETVTCSWEIE